MEACDESWSPRSNATSLAGYAITTTTTKDSAYLKKPGRNRIGVRLFVRAVEENLRYSDSDAGLGKAGSPHGIIE